MVSIKYFLGNYCVSVKYWQKKKKKCLDKLLGRFIWEILIIPRVNCNEIVNKRNIGWKLKDMLGMNARNHHEFTIIRTFICIFNDSFNLHPSYFVFPQRANPIINFRNPNITEIFHLPGLPPSFSSTCPPLPTIPLHKFTQKSHSSTTRPGPSCLLWRRGILTRICRREQRWDHKMKVWCMSRKSGRPLPDLLSWSTERRQNHDVSVNHMAERNQFIGIIQRAATIPYMNCHIFLIVMIGGL